MYDDKQHNDADSNDQGADHTDSENKAQLDKPNQVILLAPAWRLLRILTWNLELQANDTDDDGNDDDDDASSGNDDDDDNSSDDDDDDDASSDATNDDDDGDTDIDMTSDTFDEMYHKLITQGT